MLLDIVFLFVAAGGGAWVLRKCLSPRSVPEWLLWSTTLLVYAIAFGALLMSPVFALAQVTGRSVLEVIQDGVRWQIPIFLPFAIAGVWYKVLDHSGSDLVAERQNSAPEDLQAKVVDAEFVVVDPGRSPISPGSDEHRLPALLRRIRWPPSWLAAALLGVLCLALLAWNIRLQSANTSSPTTPAGPDSAAAADAAVAQALADARAAALLEAPRPDPAPTPTPEEAARDAVDQLRSSVLSTSGLGPVRIGMSVREVEQRIGSLSIVHETDGQCAVYHPEDTRSVHLLFESDRLTRISAYRERLVRTPRGIRAGSTRDEVRAAYGRGLEEYPHIYAEPGAEYLAYDVPAQDGGMPGEGVMFETDPSGVVVALHAGIGSVRWVEGCL